MLPIILCSRPHQRYAWHGDRQIYIRRNNYKFRTSSEKNTSVYKVYWNTGKGADLSVVKFVKVFVAWRDSAYSQLGAVVLLPL